MLSLEHDARSEATHHALANARGEFRIENLPRGRHILAVEASGLLSPYGFMSAGQGAERRAVSSFAPELRGHFEEVVLDGRNTVEVVVRARRGGAVSGRVTYADGDPAVNVPVAILRRRGGVLSRVLAGMNTHAMFGTVTDDRGVYRASGLPPGEYFVSVSEVINHGGRREEWEGLGLLFSGSQLATTYYGLTTDPEKAAPVSLEAGQEAEGIDIVIVERPAFKLSGVVRSRHDGRPVRGAFVRVGPKEAGRVADVPTPASPYDGGASLGSVVTDEQGRWEFTELPDGLYDLSVYPPSAFGGDDEETPASTRGGTNANMNANMNANFNVSAGGRSGASRRRKFLPKSLEVKVAGEDLSDVQVELSFGVNLSGAVELEGGKPPRDARVMVIAEPRNEPRAELGEGTQSAIVDDDGRFTVMGLRPGETYLTAYALKRGRYDQQIYFVKSVSWRGRDYMREPLSVGEGEDLSGVRVVLTDEAGELSGRVLSASDGKTPAAGAVVFLLPADEGRWNYPTARSGARADGEGNYEVRALPGDYLVFTLGPGYSGVSPRVELFKARAESARRVSLRAGERRSLELVLHEEKK